jgi:hypothetical protein
MCMRKLGSGIRAMLYKLRKTYLVQEIRTIWKYKLVLGTVL